MTKNHEGTSIYDENFYKKNHKTEYAAKTIVDYLFGIFPHESVVDIGCGRGAWLVACKMAGAKTLYGIDGHWNTQKDMLDQSIKFFQADLEKNISILDKTVFDICISLEVAEHLSKDHASHFISSLCKASEVVIFSAAFEGQGGTGHINENKHSYWADIFLQKGYLPFDIIRPKYWGDESIDFWYKQNIFIYIKKESAAFGVAEKNGFQPLTAFEFMDAIHPDLYRIKCEHRLSTRDLLKAFPGALRNTLLNRVERLRLYLFGRNL